MIRWSMKDFGEWLCEKQDVYVGRSGSWFSSPLSLYLRERVGQPYYVDGQVYGPMAADVYWDLPAWAKRLYALLGGQPSVRLTGAEVSRLLTYVERY